MAPSKTSAGDRLADLVRRKLEGDRYLTEREFEVDAAAALADWDAVRERRDADETGDRVPGPRPAKSDGLFAG